MRYMKKHKKGSVGRLPRKIMGKQILLIVSALYFFKADAQNNAIFNGGNGDGFSVSCAGSVGNEVPLPIQLVSFTGECDKPNITLKWCTASEANSDYYTIERSADALSWVVIGIVDAAGNSPFMHNYSFTDTNQYNGISYYRFKYTDYDGKYKYCNNIAIEQCENDFTGLILYPNPSDGTFNLAFIGNREQIYLMEIYNILGEKIYSAERFESIIDLSGKQSGIYFVHLNFNSKSIIEKVVIKE